MSATIMSVLRRLTVPRGATLVEGQQRKSLGGNAPHNAGVGSSSLPPAICRTTTYPKVVEGCATIGATSEAQNPPDPYADSRILVAWKWAI